MAIQFSDNDVRTISPREIVMQITSKLVVRCSVITLVSVTLSSSADVLLFDLEQGREAWEAALIKRGLLLKGTFDLTAQFGDPGTAHMQGPLEIGDSGKLIDSNMHPWGLQGRAGHDDRARLVIFGSSQGFGNAETAIVANLAPESFDILIDGPTHAAAEFNAVSFVGSDLIDMTVFSTEDDREVIGQFSALDAPPEGHRYGIIVDGGHSLGRINIYDLENGAQGIVGTGAFYYRVPTPAGMFVIGFCGLICKKRRR